MINVDQCEKFLKKYLDNYNLIAKIPHILTTQ